MEFNKLRVPDVARQSGLSEVDCKALQNFINGNKDTFPLIKMEKIFEKFVDFEVKK